MKRILSILLAPFRPSTFPPGPWTLEQVDGPVPVFPAGMIARFESDLAAATARKAVQA